jgi:NNP family nitrate/nitrite transporter-like MFS transporter
MQETRASQEKSPYRWIVLTMGILVNMFAIGMNWTCMASLFGEIQNSIPMTYSQWGLAWGMVPLAMVAFCVPGGIAGDRFGIRLTIGMGILFLSAAGIARAFSHSFVELSVTMFLFGVGLSFLSPNLPKSVGLWFPPEELGLANGVLLAGYVLGGAIALAYSGTTFTALLGSWQQVVVAYGVISSLLGITWLVCVNEPGRRPSYDSAFKGPTTAWENLSTMARIRDLRLTLGSQFFLFGGLLGLVGFLPDMLTQMGMSKGAADWCVSLIYWGNMVGVIAVPALSDRMGLRKIFIWPLALLGSVAVLLVGLAQSPLLLFCLCTLLGLLIGFIPLIVVLPMEMKEIGPHRAGTALGMLWASGNLGSFLSPVLGGAIIDVTGKNWGGFLLWALLLAACALCILPTRETGLKGSPASSPVPQRAPSGRQ